MDNYNFFSGLLSSPKSAGVENDSFRRYASTLTTVADFGINNDSTSRLITYQIGKAGSVKSVLAAPSDGALRTDASYNLPPSTVDDFSSMARRYTHFTANFSAASLAGVVDRLARVLALSSFYTLDGASIRAGAPINVVSLAATSSPVSASSSCVFIPRLVDTLIAPDVFSVLCSAIAGEGGKVVTDIVDIDANTKAAIVPDVTDENVASACVDALRLLGANMAASGAGAVFAYALTRGIHRAVSVVAHTDEGGIVRDCLRAGEFGVPYGGIHSGLNTYVGLPALNTTSATGIAGYVDALAIGTAALVAHCDPGMVVNGRFIPTVLDGSKITDPIVNPGNAYAGVQDHGRAILSQLRTAADPFIRLYCSALATAFGVPQGDASIAERHFTSVVCVMSATRHMWYPSVAPFFWVEPTSIVPPDYLGTSAEAAGAASYAARGGCSVKPFFQAFTYQGEYTSTHTQAAVALPFARSSPLLLHLNGHAENGTSAIVPRQFDPNLIIHPGPCEQHVELRDRHSAAAPMSSYLWVRGQSPLCAPGELINLGGTMGLEFRHASVTCDGLVIPNHVPSPAALINGTITFFSSPPVGISAGPLGDINHKVARARTRATVEVQQVRARSPYMGLRLVSQCH